MVKLNLGCGNRNFGTDWTHIDGAEYPHVDSHNVISLDYRDKSVDLIFADSASILFVKLLFVSNI